MRLALKPRRDRTADAVDPYAKLVEKRIENCKDTIRSNCIGTALYIVGVHHVDRFTYYGAHEFYLSKMQQLASPSLRSLVAWELRDAQGRAEVVHMGVVVNLNPLLVTNRKSRNGFFVQNETVENAGIMVLTAGLTLNYNSDQHAINFYLPPRTIVSTNSNGFEVVSAHENQARRRFAGALRL